MININTILVCPKCKGTLFLKKEKLICRTNHNHNFTKNNDIYNFIINLENKKEDKIWAKNLENIHLMRTQIKNDSKRMVPSINATDNNKVHKFIAGYINKKDFFIELGCGNGAMAQYFKEYNYIGLDPICPEEYNYPFIQGIVESLPIITDSLNLCFCKDSLSYYRSLSLVFNETSRILKNDGIFIITEFVGKYYNNPFLLFLRKFIRRLLNRIRGRIDWEDTEFKFRLKKDIMEFVVQSNFVLIEDIYNPNDQRLYIVLKNNK